MSSERAYSVHCAMDGYLVVNDDSELMACCQLEHARLIAALMNGDIGALAKASSDDAANCSRFLHAALQPLRQVGRPALALSFPLL